MADQVDLSAAFGVPEIHGENEEGAIHVLEVDLLACVRVTHDQANARRRSNGASVLVTKPAHSGSDGLLLDFQREYSVAFAASQGLEMVIDAAVDLLDLLALAGRQIHHAGVVRGGGDGRE